MIALFASSDIDRAAAQLGLLKDDIEKARAQALRKTIKWAEREAAKGLSREAGIPYKAARIRTWKKVRISTGGTITLGLNPISAKYLPKRQFGKTFTAPKLNEHRFRRVGKARLPIQKVEKEIEEKGAEFAQSEFVLAIQEHLVEEFFALLDKRSGRTAGTAATILR